MTRVRFHPQAWMNDYAITVDPEGQTEWEVGEVPASLKSNSDESDSLRDHPNAPAWVQAWRGPFFIEILHDKGPA